ncbi:hypothetical protein ACFL4G_13465, partial [Thermodesulfobacteriota bacterium]
MIRTSIITLLAAIAMLCAVPACTPTPKPYDPPGRTAWEPEGCRAVPQQDPVLGSRTHFRNLHGDAMNTDEVTIALTPVFELDWIAEPEKFIYGGPVFDTEGNLYFSPIWPVEEVLLISLDPEDGSRRWAIPGTPNTIGSPMVGVDPDTNEEIIYLGLYSEAMAVKTDGTILWHTTDILEPL